MNDPRESKLSLPHKAIAWLTAAAIVGSFASMVLSFGSAWASANDELTTREFSMPHDALPRAVPAVTTVRAFGAAGADGGHTDFSPAVSAVRAGMVAYTLGSNSLPTLASTTGRRIERPPVDSRGRPIPPHLMDTDRGDSVGSISPRSDPRVESAASFAEWFSDDHAAAVDRPDLTFARARGSDTFVLDLARSQALIGLDSTSPQSRYTVELSVPFRAGEDRYIRVSSGGDAWVFVDDHLVIDLGGPHRLREQLVELDRIDLPPSANGHTLRVFFAKRLSTGGSLRVETNLALGTADGS